MSRTPDPAELRRWLDSRQEAARVERDLARAAPPEPSAAWERAARLREAFPIPSTPAGQAENMAYHEVWSILRAKARQT